MRNCCYISTCTFFQDFRVHAAIAQVQRKVNSLPLWRMSPHFSRVNWFPFNVRFLYARFIYARFMYAKKLRSSGIYLRMHENSYRNVNSFLSDRVWHTIRKLTKINPPPLFSLNLNSFNSIKSSLETSKWHSKWKWNIHKKFKTWYA